MKNEEYKCELCNFNEFKYIQNYKFTNELFRDRKIVSCKKCGVKFIFPPLQEHELNDYNKYYYLNAHNDLKLNKTAKTFFNAIAKCRIYFLKNFLIKKKINLNNILEIGPGRGHFYEQFVKNYKSINYSIIESDLNYINKFKNKNVTIHNGLEEISNKRFDLIVFSHVLEHIMKPNEFLTKINKILNNNGIIFLEVPCLDYLYKDVFEPHVFFYDKVSLSLLLKKNNFFNHEIFYYGKNISMMQSKSIYTKFKSKLISIILKLNLTFLIRIIDERKYSFLDNKNEKIIADIYEMNSEQDQPSWWMRALIIKD